MNTDTWITGNILIFNDDKTIDLIDYSQKKGRITFFSKLDSYSQYEKMSKEVSCVENKDYDNVIKIMEKYLTKLDIYN